MTMASILLHREAKRHSQLVSQDPLALKIIARNKWEEQKRESMEKIKKNERELRKSRKELKKLAQIQEAARQQEADLLRAKQEWEEANSQLEKMDEISRATMKAQEEEKAAHDDQQKRWSISRAAGKALGKVASATVGTGTAVGAVAVSANATIIYKQINQSTTIMGKENIPEDEEQQGSKGNQVDSVETLREQLELAKLERELSRIKLERAECAARIAALKAESRQRSLSLGEGNASTE